MPASSRGERNIVEHGTVVEQMIVLKDELDGPAGSAELRRRQAQYVASVHDDAGRWVGIGALEQVNSSEEAWIFRRHRIQ